MPLLNTIGGASIRSHGRGRGGGGVILDTKVNATSWSGSTVSKDGGTLSQYFSSMTIGSNAQALKTQAEFTRVGNGILLFTIPAGTYNWSGKSGDGSGDAHWTGFSATGVMTFSADTDVMLLVPNNGTGEFCGGGGLFLVTGTNYASPTGAILVMGGGAGGWQVSGAHSLGAPGPFTSSTTTASIQRSTNTSYSYDGGAGLFNSYVVEGYGTGPGVAEHFVQGGRGGTVQACRVGYSGGFGGGGGTCPAGAGGYVGDRAAGGSYIGGGGTS